MLEWGANSIEVHSPFFVWVLTSALKVECHRGTPTGVDGGRVGWRQVVDGAGRSQNGTIIATRAGALFNMQRHSRRVVTPNASTM